LLDSPEINAPVSPVGKQKVKRTPCSPVLVARAYLYATALIRLFNDVIEV
jgi:hypothetical protein